MATKIYIDQGHNPVNPNAGSEGNGYREQDLVYKIGVELSKILQSRGFSTKLSRKSEDSQLGTSTLTSLQARVFEANEWGADYFISLHTNASQNKLANGSEALVYSVTSNAGRLAKYILEQLNLTTGLRTRGVISRPGLYVLRKTKMPAVLTELGFITNEEEANLMAKSPDLFALGVANGISDYLSSLVDAFAQDNKNGENSKNPLSKLIKRGYSGIINLKSEEKDDNDYKTELKNESKAVSFDEEDFEKISYEDFLSENPLTGLLRIQAYRANKAFPLPKVEIMICRKFSNGEKVFFTGETDENGIIDDIELPAPSMLNSLDFESKDTNSLFLLKATKEGYEKIERTIEIFEGIKTIQPLLMDEIWREM